MTPHYLRHFNATLMDSLNIPASVQRSRLGHAGETLTHHYTHTFSKDDSAAAEAIGSLLELKTKVQLQSENPHFEGSSVPWYNLTKDPDFVKLLETVAIEYQNSRAELPQ